jgi:SNF2 family DNA or RNA helicase
VFLGQIAAAGVGLTLTAATDVVFVEGAWTPAAHDQAIDRCHGRLNDPRGAVGWYLLAEGTIDEAIWALLDRKRRVVDAVTDGVRREDDGSVVGSLLVQLARRGLADRKREVTSV